MCYFVSFVVYTEKSAVMFSAAMDGGGDHGPFNTNKILIYNTVLANVGAAYNKFTGIVRTVTCQCVNTA